MPQGKDQSEPVNRWSKKFLEAGKKRLAGDTAREATSDEVKELKAEARQLKETANHMRVVRGMFRRFGVCVVPVPERHRLPISDLAVLHQQWDRGPQVVRERRP